MELDEARTYALEAVIDKFVVKHPGARDGRRDLRYDIEKRSSRRSRTGCVWARRCGSGLPGLRQRRTRTVQNQEPAMKVDERFSVLGSRF